MENLQTWLTGNGIGGLDIVGICAVIAPFLPPTYRAVLGVVVQLINIGAFNFLWARNEAKPGDPIKRPKSCRHSGG